MNAQSSGRSRQVSREEEPSLRGHGLVVAEEVLEHREPRPLRVGALRDLRQLVRVAEQDEGPRAVPTASTSASASCPASSTKSTSSGRSAAWMSTASREKAHAVPATSWNAGSAQTSPSFDVTMHRLSNPVSVSGSPRLAPANANPCRSASCCTARRKLWIALWLSEVTPTRFPARMSAIAIRAPCHVFPEPGGPCTKR